MDNTYSKFFRAALRAEVAADAAYEAEVRDWYENGDGRSPDWQTDVNEFGEVQTWNAGGSGYSFPHCKHGMSRWTDYDNICGGCEDGLSPIQRAQGVARANYREWRRRVDLTVSIIAARAPEAAQNAMLAWVQEASPE